MKLGYIYTPVKDFEAALRFYRDTLGFEEFWREGELAAGFKLPDSNVALMIDRDPREEGTSAFFAVDSVDEFYEKRKDELDFLFEPREIPPGKYVAFADPSGNPVRIMDSSKERAE